MTDRTSGFDTETASLSGYGYRESHVGCNELKITLIDGAVLGGNSG
ncbi:hypothetical protein [Herpetosiphon sp.]|nr:hypothetical protein [Herpetosiphon sp.]